MPVVPVSITVEPGTDTNVPFGQNISTAYTLTGPDGTRAVFNNMADRDYVGMLTEITGLDSPEVRESAEEAVQMDGGLHGDFFFGRRPVTLTGLILNPASVGERDRRMTKIARASNAMRADAQLSWVSEGGVQQYINVRRQQPLRVSGGWQKSFQLGLVAADPRIYNRDIKVENVATTLSAPTSPTTIAQDDFTSFTSGVLNGRTAPIGGTWATLSSTGVGDFVPSTTPTGGASVSIHSLIMTAVLGPIVGDVDVVADFRADNDAANGIMARYVTQTRNVYLFAKRNSTSTSASAGIIMRDSTSGYLTLATLPITVADLSASPNYLVRGHLHVYESGVVVAELRRVADNSLISSATASHPDLATGGELATGQAGFTGSEYDATGNVYFDSFTATTTVGISGIAAEMTVTNEGSALTYPILQISGPGTNPTIRNYTTGQQIAFDVTLAAGDTLLVDTLNRTIYLNDLTAYETLDFNNTDWWGLAPGDNRLLLSFTDFDTGANMAVQFRDAWI